MNKEKELNKEAVECIAKMIMNYYQKLKENSCNQKNLAVPYNPLKEEIDLYV